tara:strand:- start:273 stop:875 length:603 start_codon:yes stop_codon:yes gene_type:complete
MHKLKVLIIGPSAFISTLNELKPFLKFIQLNDPLTVDHDIILFHQDALKDAKLKDHIHNSNSIKIFTSQKKLINNYDAYLKLPTTLKEINSMVENLAAKKKFNKNSSIEIKNYLLNKNEKKLSKKDDFIILTEKETQLLELFLDSKIPISKNNILSSVWNYSPDADTHTVETHIYRLRKKISDKFMDDKFILNNKDGYYL